MMNSALRIFSPTDAAWDEAFQRLPAERRDVFHTASYARLCQNTLNRNDKVLCAISNTESDVILYPFAIRNLEGLIGSRGAGLRDMVGLYGRNGVLCSPGTSDSALFRFHADLADFVSKQRVICSFDRFHPVIANEQQSAVDTEIIDVGNFIVISLERDIDTVESYYKYSIRKDVSKAIRNSVSTFIEDLE